MQNLNTLERRDRSPLPTNTANSRGVAFTVEVGASKHWLHINQTDSTLTITTRKMDGTKMQEGVVQLNDPNVQFPKTLIDFVISLPREAIASLPDGFVANLYNSAQQNPELANYLAGVTRDRYYDGGEVPLSQADAINPKKASRLKSPAR